MNYLLHTILVFLSLVVSLIASSVKLQAQFLPRDSLLKELELRRNQHRTQDSEYVRLLFLTARSFRPNTQQMRPYIDEARVLTMNSGSKRLMGHLYLGIGNILRLERRFTEARDTLQLALTMFTALKDSSQMASTAGLIAVMYYQRDMFATALQYYTKQAEIAEHCGDIKNAYLALLNISQLHLAMEQPEQALHFARLAEPLVRKNNNHAFFVEWYKGMSFIHRKLLNLDSALLYAEQGLQSAWLLNDSLLILNTMLQKTSALREQKAHNEARLMVDSLLHLERQFIQGGVPRPAAYALAACVLFSSAQDSTQNAAQKNAYLRKALYFANCGLEQSTTTKKETAEFYAILAEIYHALGNTQSAFHMQRRLLTLRDSLFQTSIQSHLLDIHERYALRQKDQEIAVLQERGQYERFVTLAVIGFALGALVFAGVALSRYRIKRRSEEQLQQVYEQLEAEHKKTLLYQSRVETQNEELRTQENALRRILQQQQFMALVARYTSQLVIITDRSGRTQFVNKEFERMTGYAAEELLGRKIGELLQGPDTDQTVVGELRESIRTATMFNGDLLNYTKDGHPYWIRIALTPVFNEQGECEHFVAIEYDVTAEKRLQAEERIQAQLTMQSMIDSSRDISILVSKDFQMLQFNRAAYRAMREMHPDIEPEIGIDMRKYSPIPLAEVERDFTEVLCGKTVAFDLDIPNPRNTDEKIAFEINYNPVRNLSGDVIAIGFVARNITQRKQAQAQIEQMNLWLEERVQERTSELEKRALELSAASNKIATAYSELEVAQLELWETNHQLGELIETLANTNRLLEVTNHEKSEILGIVAHDLKNPIGAVRGLADVIVQGFADKEQIPQISEQIVKTSDRMLDMVKNLLEMNRLESDGMRFTLLAVDVAPMVESTVWQYQEQAKAKGITLHYRNETASAGIIADEQAIVQVLDNLISNAVKYSPHGKNVYVRITSAELSSSQAPSNQTLINQTLINQTLINQTPSNQVTNYLRIEIQDEGPGISEEDMKKLFGKFARLSAQPTGGEHSTGLGLNIVKKLVEAMQGRVWCESEEGKGATFIVELPLA